MACGTTNRLTTRQRNRCELIQAAVLTRENLQQISDLSEWRRHSEHLEAQQRGREEWYRRYTLRIARVEQSKKFDADNAT